MENPKEKAERFLTRFITSNASSEHRPSPDVAICSNCRGRFKTGEYDLEWESEGSGPEAYDYLNAVCRVCGPDSCIDDWDYSNEMFKKLMEWEKANNMGGK